MKKYKILLGSLLALLAIGIIAWYFHHTPIAVLDPKGIVAQKERNLIVLALSLSLIVVIPVYILLFSFAWRYRESNTKAKYSPNLDHNAAAETLWWLIPSAVIVVLAVVAWNSSHQLDPFRPLSSNVKPMNIEVIALDWKWLFIYPQQKIASVNFVQFPKNTPITFNITSDTVMNSFWLPQLGGQIYAMPGMSTQLHLMADSDGNFNGSSANISGSGFAGMTFMARASTETDFQHWVQSVRQTPRQLDPNSYSQLAAPSQNNPVTYYSSVASQLYNETVMKYMMPSYDVAPAETQ